MGCIRRLTGQMGLCPAACKKVLLACVQASALYGAELWWDDRKGAGVKNRCDELQKLENQMGPAVTGNFRTTNLGVVMAESGLRPAESVLNRSRRHVLRLMSLPRGNQAKSLPGGNTPMGQRMVHFSEYSGRVEEIAYRKTDRRNSRRTSQSPTQSGRNRRRGGRTPNWGWCSGRTGPGTRTVERGMRWCGGKGGGGPGGRSTWDISRRRTMRSARRSRERWQWQRAKRNGTSSEGFGSSQMHKPPLRG